jgi:hypothetical protein
MKALQKALSQMTEEFHRLDDFIKRFDNYTSSDPQQGRAVLETQVVIIGTQNHGVFKMDHADIIEHLHIRKDKLEKELRNLTVLGEDIRQLRTQSKDTQSD